MYKLSLFCHAVFEKISIVNDKVSCHRAEMSIDLKIGIFVLWRTYGDF